ncbi:hypothetical protein B0H13DRAFT_2380817 [Mycena leptocephala]|nr:hypothetical protein B0H13DRAFT_2380817 [Mycena leptocephala]
MISACLLLNFFYHHLTPFFELGGLAGYYDGILYPTVSLEELSKGYFNLTGHFSSHLFLLLQHRIVLAGRRFDIILSDSARSKSSSVVSFLALRPTSLFADLRLSPLVLGLGQHSCIRFPEGSCIIIAYQFVVMLNFILASFEYPLIIILLELMDFAFMSI